MKIDPRYYLLILLLAVTAKKISGRPHDMEIIKDGKRTEAAQQIPGEAQING